MTHDPDDKVPPDEPEGSRSGGTSGGTSEGDRKLDEDAAWQSIIENYGDASPVDVPVDEFPPVAPAETDPPAEPLRFAVFERRWKDPLDTEATWADEGHFVPPEPPPIPPLEPRRKLAWIGLFGSPAVMLAAVVLGWQYPTWVTGMLVAGFVGGFVFLVATMPRTRFEDGSGDDGAVV